ncbi:MAG: cytidine deaminase [Gammaproteobacteria bacterium]|nr:cytidine deaminase [Gammaproteobacteria bacterium]
MLAKDILIDQARAVRERAYAPYSHFQVGACIESKNGNVYVGCNVENASYGLTVCAEANAIAAMVAGGEHEIVQMVVVIEGPGVSSCCGACRQRLNEFTDPEALIHFCDLVGNVKTLQFQDLFPYPFGPQDLSKRVITS